MLLDSLGEACMSRVTLLAEGFFTPQVQAYTSHAHAPHGPRTVSSIGSSILNASVTQTAVQGSGNTGGRATVGTRHSDTPSAVSLTTKRPAAMGREVRALPELQLKLELPVLAI